MSDFEKNRFIFEKNEHFIIFPQKIHLKYEKGSLQLLVWKKFRKSQLFDFCQYFFIFSKNQKISNLSRDKAPEFQNNVIVDMKTALDGGKTLLFRRRGHRKIQKESYLTLKKL